MTNRTIIIGDVHGCLRELRGLLEIVNPTSEDTIVFVGDLVDKGPDSVGVVRFVRTLCSSTNVVVVEGNHEEKHKTHRKRLSQGKVRPGPVDEITKRLSDEDIEFMDSFVPFHRVLEHDILVVHGGIPGNWPTFPETVEEFQGLSKRLQKRFRKISRTRHVCRETGKFRSLGDESPEDPFWTDVYGGRFGHVVFGHEPFVDGPQVREHSTGVDTGCVLGGGLTGLVIDEDGTRSFVSFR